MLVAGTALSLIAPIGAQASDVDIEGMNNYTNSNSSSNKQFNSKSFTTELATLEKSVDLVEDRINDIEAGSFSSTTTMDGKAIMWIGAVDGITNIDDDEDGLSSDEPRESVATGYTFTVNLNTSFAEKDNLYVRLKGGDAADAWKSKPATYHIDTKDTDDAIKIDKIWYQFPIGDNVTAFVGPRIENYYMYVTPSIYKPGALKAFKLGGNSNFGASTDNGFGFKWETDSGFAIASNVVDKNGDSNGFFQDNGVSKWDTQIAYTQDRYHVSLTYSDAQNWTSQVYNATALGENTATDSYGYALRAYWMPEDSGTAIPEVSLGYDVKNWEDVTTHGAVDEADSYFIGLTWKDIFQGDDRIGFAVTQPLKATHVHGGGATNEVDDPMIWEAYYSWKQNDSITITPAVFGGTDVFSHDDNTFGAVVTTAFKF